MPLTKGPQLATVLKHHYSLGMTTSTHDTNKKQPHQMDCNARCRPCV